MRILPFSLGISLLLLSGCWASGTDPVVAGEGKGAAESPGSAVSEPPDDGDAADSPASGEPGPAADSSDTGSTDPSQSEPSPASSDARLAAPTPDLVTAEQIHVAFGTYLKGLKKDGDGLLRLFDDRSSEDLELEFLSVTPGARKVEGRGYLVEASFAARGGEEGRNYDLHFWLNFRTDRDDKAEPTDLDVTDTRIFRVPKKLDGKWTMEARYDMASERPIDVK